MNLFDSDFDKGNRTDWPLIEDDVLTDLMFTDTTFTPGDTDEDILADVLADFNRSAVQFASPTTTFTPNKIDASTDVASHFYEPLHPAPFHTLRVAGIIMLMCNTLIIVAVYRWGRPAALKRASRRNRLGMLNTVIAVESMLELGRAEAHEINEAILRGCLFAHEDSNPVATEHTPVPLALIHAKRDRNTENFEGYNGQLLSGVQT
jgi:hypothetical protein